MVLKRKLKIIKDNKAQAAVEFLMVFIVFTAIMFYIYSLGISLLGLQNAEYFGFMVGRTITDSAKRYGSGSGTATAGITKYGTATKMLALANKNILINAVSRLSCGIDGSNGYRKILNYSNANGPRVASSTGIACRVSAPGLLPMPKGVFLVAFDELMGSDISDDHAACAMSFKKDWLACLKDETIPSDEIIVNDNGS